MTHVLGIDFGTTNTVAAWMDADGAVHKVPVREGGYALPSVVCYHRQGSILVGDAARELIAADPENTIFSTKRFLGRRYASEFVARNSGRFAFRLLEGPDALTAVEIYGQLISLEDVAFHILNRIVELANIALGAPFDECVIAVPAHFSQRQRQIVRRVAERLLTVRAMVNEPTAAALHCAVDSGKDQRILVYDLGGGTFDATLLHVKDDVVEVQATGGDAFLGGNDFDARVVKLLLERFQDEHHTDVGADPVVMQRLAFAAEAAKMKLSMLQSTNVRIPCLAVKGESFIDLETTLHRRELESVCAPLIEQTLGVTEDIVRRAGLAVKDVAELVLVGGQTRMPALRDRLSRSLGIPIRKDVDPDAAVACGAALLGRGGRGLVDVLSLPICVMSPETGAQVALRSSSILPAGERLPIPRRPLSGALNVIFYEAVDETAIERDILGRASVPADWLSQNPGELALDVRMDASFVLTASVHASDGGRLPVEVKDLAPANAPSPRKTSAPPPFAVARGAPRVTTRMRVGVRVQGSDDLLVAETVNLSSSGVLLQGAQRFSPGTRLEIFFERDLGPLTLRGEVVRDEATKGSSSANAGVHFVELSPKDMEALERHVRLLGAVESPLVDVSLDLDDDPPAAPAAAAQAPRPATAVSAAERLRRFLTNVATQNLYEALGLAALASPHEVREQLDALRAVMAALGRGASGPMVARLETASRILERTARVLLDPRQRLEHDFRLGHVYAEERIEKASSEADFGVLREAWHKTHPEEVDKAALHVAKAMQAGRNDDYAAAVHAGQEALKLDPFNFKLRASLVDWTLKAGAG